MSVRLLLSQEPRAGLLINNSSPPESEDSSLEVIGLPWLAMRLKRSRSIAMRAATARRGCDGG